MKDKRKLIIIISLFVLIITAIYFLFIKNRVKFHLIGDRNMVISYGIDFIDPGFIAEDGMGNSLEEKVNVFGSVNNTVPGIYKITYILNYDNKEKQLERIIQVKEQSIDDFEIKLNDGNEMYLLKDDNYIEKGATVYNKYNHSIYTNKDYLITSNVNTNICGEYSVIYSFSFNGETITVTRKVVVLDINYTITPATMTKNSVKIEFNLNNISNYSFTKLPNNYTELSKNIKYEVTKNGDYTFIIALSNNVQIKKIVTINNIMDSYTCSGIVNSSGTKIEVKPTSNEIKEYEWIIDGETIKGTNIFTKNKAVNDAKVNVVFKNQEKYLVNCNITDNLVYHFKYDEYNTKPFMTCKSYTSQDKIKYDAMLKQVVQEAGYGTRAGVVAAARFLVGGLDYKVPYLGPKQVDTSLGRYRNIGLNIGRTGAWGCMVSGWTQGMDCTNFILWAFYQNGITSYPYNTNYKKVREVINQVRVGDLLYTPCNSNECKNTYKLDHVGIIIGIDDKYIYVAEATTGRINAIVVSKWDKYNMPEKGQFSIVHFFNYSSDGNVTDMWM